MTKRRVISTSAADLQTIGIGGPAKILKPITLPALVGGAHGRAWLCNLPEGLRRAKVSETDDATLAYWIVEASWAHPIWHSYAIVLVHLRPLPDLRPTKFYLANATHELWVMALDPDADRAAIIEGELSGRWWLQPKNFAAQFIEATDDLALARIRAAVQRICDGRLSPDSDLIHQWVALFGDNMLRDRTVATRH